jgi:glycosyltransferase involved in cell wall biosynthesis
MGRSILTNQPFIITRDLVPGMMREIKRIIVNRRFDFIHADQLWMVQYALQAKRLAASAGMDVRLVLDQHNAVYLIPKRLKVNAVNPVMKLFLDRESRLLAHFEADVCQKCDQVVWVTREDLEAIKRIKGDTLIHSKIIPICVDPASVSQPEQLSTLPNILFLGGMHWPPNAEGVRWFVRHVLPLVRNELPEARLTVIGKSPPREITDVEGVQANGFVKDVSSFWKESRVFIVPIHAAGGMRVKILDAWAHGLPVVSTTIGAEGITTQPGNNIQIADDAAEFSRCVLQLLNDDRFAECLSHAGRETLEEYYDWKKVYRSWDEVYQPAS